MRNCEAMTLTVKSSTALPTTSTNIRRSELIQQDSSHCTLPRHSKNQPCVTRPLLHSPAPSLQSVLRISIPMAESLDDFAIPYALRLVKQTEKDFEASLTDESLDERAQSKNPSAPLLALWPGTLLLAQVASRRGPLALVTRSDAFCCARVLPGRAKSRSPLPCCFEGTARVLGPCHDVACGASV